MSSLYCLGKSPVSPGLCFLIGKVGLMLIGCTSQVPLEEKRVTHAKCKRAAGMQCVIRTQRLLVVPPLLLRSEASYRLHSDLVISHRSSGFWFRGLRYPEKELLPTVASASRHPGTCLPDGAVLAGATSDAYSLPSSQLCSQTEKLVTRFLHWFPGCGPHRKTWFPLNFLQRISLAEPVCPGPCEILADVNIWQHGVCPEICSGPSLLSWG